MVRAVGGAAFNYPEDIGYPVGTSDTVQYVMMETHYNNPNQLPITDSSGMKYVITSMENLSISYAHTCLMSKPSVIT